MRKLYCVGRAVPTLPINLEDAARSDVEVEKALQVTLITDLWLFNIVIIVSFFFSLFKLHVNGVSQWVQAGDQLVRVNQDTRLNFRVLDLRTPANQGIFRIQSHVGNVKNTYHL